MKRSGRSIALAVVGLLFWSLAIVHPFEFHRARKAALRAQPTATVTPRIYTLLSQAKRLQDRLRSSEIIGYVSEGEVDLRVGGPLQGRYYLAQYALAPTLLDLGVELERDRDSSLDASGQAVSHDLVLACFRQPRQLETFLVAESRQSVLVVSPNVALTRGRGDDS